MRRLSFWLFASILLFPAVALAHGVVGRRLFVEPFATEDANTFSEAGISSTWIKRFDEKEWELHFGVGLQLSENVGLDLEGDRLRIETEDGTESGFESPEMTLKYVIQRSPARESITTLSLTFAPASGDSQIGAEPFSSISPGLLFGKGLGGLPDALWYLRPFLLQGNVGLHVHLTQSDDPEELHNNLAYNLFIAYSLPYLQQSVRDVGLQWPLNRLFIASDFNFEMALNGPETGGTEAFARPGLIWVGKGVQWGIAAVIPLNDRSGKDVGVFGQAVAYLDDLFPKTLGRPLLGGR